LDLYEGQFDFQNFTTQVHDFDPGITPYPEGLFWTIALPSSSLDVNMGAGRAMMTASNLAIRDFLNIPNALFRFQTPVSVPATASFDITWSGPVTDRVEVTDPATGFAAEFFRNHVTMTWRATNANGFSFVSDPETTSVFAELGRLRNGVFFSGHLNLEST
jgi:hypothetical protein